MRPHTGIYQYFQEPTAAAAGGKSPATLGRRPRPRRISEDRVKRNAEEYFQSLLGVRHAFEKVTFIELRHLTADNTSSNLLPTFADGYLLCYLANVLLRKKHRTLLGNLNLEPVERMRPRLEAAQYLLFLCFSPSILSLQNSHDLNLHLISPTRPLLVPTTHPNRPSDLDSTSPKHRGLTKQEITENFKVLERVWDDIGMQDVVFPSPQGPLCLVLEQSIITTEALILSTAPAQRFPCTPLPP